MTPDPWTALRAHTAARIALGRSGASLPTAELLRFGVAHAQARDAVHQPFDTAALRAELESHGFETIEVESAAAGAADADPATARTVYLRRPDLGRTLSERSRALLASLGGQGADPAGHRGDGAAGPPATDGNRCDLLCVVGDGLSATAVHRQAVPLLLELRPRLEGAGLRLGQVVLARQARVALGDEIGGALHAAAVLVLVGERPGLSSPDSLGAYLTRAPRPGRSDAERNCVSNIRPAGLPPAVAAQKLAWLIEAARRLGATGVRLKDDSDRAALPPAAPPAGLPASAAS